MQRVREEVFLFFPNSATEVSITVCKLGMLLSSHQPSVHLLLSAFFISFKNENSPDDQTHLQTNTLAEHTISLKEEIYPTYLSMNPQILNLSHILGLLSR